MMCDVCVTMQAAYVRQGKGRRHATAVGKNNVRIHQVLYEPSCGNKDNNERSCCLSVCISERRILKQKTGRKNLFLKTPNTMGFINFSGGELLFGFVFLVCLKGQT